MRVRVTVTSALAMSLVLAVAAVAADSGFIENRGQVDARVAYYTQAEGGTVYLTRDAIVLDLREVPAEARMPGQPAGAEGDDAEAEAITLRGCAVYLRFEGANPAPVIEKRTALEARYNYFLGNDPSRWQTDVPAFAEIVYHDLWPGIDVEFRSEMGRIVYSLRSTAGSDPTAVRFVCEGADRVVPIEDGAVRIETPLGVFAHHPAAPNGGEGWLGGIVEGTSPHQTNDGLQERDDPSVLLWSSYLGGSDYDYGDAVEIDPVGNPVVAGFTLSPDFPVTPGAYDQSLNSASYFDVFVSKFSASGSSLLWSTYLGGSGGEGARALDIDQEGRIVVAGSTESPNFPVSLGAYDRTHNGDYDFFVAKLTRDGTGLVWGTYLGSPGADYCWDMELDSSMNPALVGETSAAGFPTSAGAFDSSLSGSSDAVVACISSSGSALLMGTYLGGTQYEYGYAIAVDASGNPIVTGTTASSNFPTTPDSYDPSYNGGDAFVTKVSSNGSSLLWSSFLGGSGNEQSWGLALDGGDNPVVTGRTSSTNFPTTPGAYDRTFNASIDTYVAKLTADGADLLWGTYLGGDMDDEPWGIALTASGAPAVVGGSNSSDYPTTAHAYDDSPNGGKDIVVSMLSSTGSALVWSTYMGGEDMDDGYAVALDPQGNPIVAGFTRSTDFPATPGAFDTSKNPWDDGIVAKFDLDFLMDVDDASPEIAALGLRGQPNPMAGRASIHYELPREMHVTLQVTDVGGRVVAAWEQGRQTAGPHDFVWNGRDAGGRRLAPGVYFARLVANSAVAATQKVTIAE